MKSTWEDIVNDFLEVGCQLSKTERDCILKIFEKQNIRSSHIQVHPTFSFNGHLVIILKQTPIHQYWIYNRLQKDIQLGLLEDINQF